MIKKAATALLAALLLLSLFGCAPSEKDTSDKLNIVATIFPPYDFARQITDGKADVKMLLSPGSESHTYEPTVADLAAVQKCDVFICIGSESDSWTEKLISSSGNSGAVVIKMTECVSLLEEELVEGMEEGEEEHGGQDDGHEFDEHVWTSLKNAVKITQAICDAVCRKDVKNADFYRENSQKYISELQKLDAEIAKTVNSASKKTIVFSERFPFRYFAEDYGLEYYAAFPGCSVGNDVALSTIAFLISKVNELGLKTVFYTEFSTEKIADTICAGTGAKKALFHSCHNVSRADFDRGVTYLDLMKQNAETLKEALN